MSNKLIMEIYTYPEISEKAKQVALDYKLNETQTLLYDFISRGEFYLAEGSGQVLFDKNLSKHSSGDRKWVKRQLIKLINDGLVKFNIVRDRRSKVYISWYFYDKEADFRSLLSLGEAYYYFKVREYLNLPEKFSKNEKYGDIEFLYTPIWPEEGDFKGYTFIFKGEYNIYRWSYDKYGLIVETQYEFGKRFGFDISNRNPLTDCFIHQHFIDTFRDLFNFCVRDGMDINIKPNNVLIIDK